MPAGAPNPVFKELNQAVGVDAAPVEIVPGPFTLQRRDGKVMVARRTITITGDFCQSTPTPSPQSAMQLPFPPITCYLPAPGQLPFHAGVGMC